MSGATLASIIATLVSLSPDPSFYWRIAFMSGIVTGLIGLALRSISLGKISKPQKTIKEPILKLFGTHKRNILKVIFVSSFSYMTFSIPFVFMNKFTPIFGQITFSEMMYFNNILLVFDMIMVPILGHIASNFDYKKWMIYSALLLGITSIPCFYLLESANAFSITIIKTWIIILGIAFVTPSKVWMFELIKSKERYLVIGLSYSIGTEILGRQTTTICWIMWHFTENAIAPAFYILFISIAAVIALMGRDESSRPL
jgi:MFS family permease